MNDFQKTRVTAFLNDEIASDAVYQALQDSFLKEREGDIHFLAASTLAVRFLKQAWKDLDKYRPEQKKDKKVVHNQGL